MHIYAGVGPLRNTFQFPSNGKAYMHILVLAPEGSEIVSIPFKRESIYAQKSSGRGLSTY